MEKTMKGLSEAFAGESMANRKYLAFAEQAEKEGYPATAKLFRTIAEAETLHALAHFRTMGGVKSTAENLQAALEGETYEFTEMYPGFIRDAEEEGQKNAVRSFTFANEAEKVHGELYKKALASMEKGKDSTFFLCPVCGYVEEGHAPDVCPICKAKKDVFVTVA
ncbi:MAG: rubrerythrin family protein [Aminobacteriaceae bacterium]